MRDYKNLEVWKLAKDFAVLVYKATNGFPREEVYGLTSQIRRAAVSVSANIAEGVGRDSDSELLRYLRIALGSLNETETLMIIAQELTYVSTEEAKTFEDRSKDLGVRMRNLATKIDSDLRQIHPR